jgi:hypothetical protein
MKGPKKSTAARVVGVRMNTLRTIKNRAERTA